MIVARGVVIYAACKGYHEDDRQAAIDHAKNHGLTQQDVAIRELDDMFIIKTKKEIEL